MALGAGAGDGGAELRAARAARFPGASAALPALPSVLRAVRVTHFGAARWPFSHFVFLVFARRAFRLSPARGAAALAPPARGGWGASPSRGEKGGRVPGVDRSRRRGLLADRGSARPRSLATRDLGPSWRDPLRLAPLSPSPAPPSPVSETQDLAQPHIPSYEDPACTYFDQDPGSLFWWKGSLNLSHVNPAMYPTAKLQYYINLVFSPEGVYFFPLSQIQLLESSENCTALDYL